MYRMRHMNIIPHYADRMSAVRVFFQIQIRYKLQLFAERYKRLIFSVTFVWHVIQNIFSLLFYFIYAQKVLDTSIVLTIIYTPDEWRE